MSLLFYAQLASATLTFTVNTLSDLVDTDITDGLCLTSAGTCSLRAAVMQSNASAAAGPSIVLPAGTYSLTRPVLGSDGPEEGDLNLTTPPSATPAVTSIIGAGAATTIINANGIDRVFEVDPDRSVAISGVALTGGSTADPRGGGAILNRGELSITASRLYDNAAALGLGGGIYNDFDAELSLERVEIARCAADEGGGIFTNAGLVINNSTIAENTATGNATEGRGGGILAQANMYLMTLSNSTLVGNQARASGGGLYAEAGEFVELDNVTVSFNVAISQQDRFAAGGGIATDNEPVIAYNSIVGGNTDGGSPASDDCFGNIEAHASNLFGSTPFCSDTQCTPVGTEGCSIVTASGGRTDLVNALGFFGAFTYQGGPTRTLALLSGSNAIDYADPSTGCQQRTDQRGARRPFGAACDVGAYEFQGADAIFDSGFD